MRNEDVKLYRNGARGSMKLRSFASTRVHPKMSCEVSDIASNFEFDHELAFDPDADFETFMRAAPAKPAVYLLSDEQARPVQLLFVRNLRYSLKNRLGCELIGLKAQAAKHIGDGRDDILVVIQNGYARIELNA